MPRDSHRTYEARNARARAEGWKSYGQARYWRPQFASSPTITARRLARRICAVHEIERSGSLFCKEVDLIVNGEGGGRPSPLWVRLGVGPEGSKWEARLVRAAVDGLR